MKLFETGIPDRELLEGLAPPPDRAKPLAVLECFEEFPCDPCKAVCPTDAIVMNRITDIPRLIPERCTGCAKCVVACPGLAIFMVWPKKNLVWVPHEFVPIPERGEIVDALDREGNVIAQAEVKAVMNARKKLETTVVCVQVPRELLMEVRAIRVREKGDVREE